MKKLKLIINTVKFLKPKQVYYRLYYLINNKFGTKSYKALLPKKVKQINWVNDFQTSKSFTANNIFSFLNITHSFNNKIDWNYNEYGKLWTYNLNYFDYLNQNNFTKEQGLYLINNFIENKEIIVDGFEPYPISLRAINWIKFLTVESINEIEINTFLYNDYLRLLDKLEYHILGNHLLENGYALLFGAYYFENQIFYDKALKILTEELEEQILEDGTHFELSPMYHKILLTKLLDCYSLICSNSIFENSDFKNLLKQKSEIMLGFLEQISFKNGTIPLLNDAAYKIALPNKAIFNYANKLQLQPHNKPLVDSGYRKFITEDFEVIMDIGKVGPKYQSGHAHADTFNFCLNYKSSPIIIDTGTSTYNIGERRNYERSTKAHNTISYNNTDSSEVWDGFRVADRAEVTILKETQSELIAEHNGYKKEGIVHYREFKISFKTLFIKDIMKGVNSENSISSLHFHPDVKLDKKEDFILVNNTIKLSWKEFDKVKILDYQYAPGFNTLFKAKKIEGVFKNESGFKFEIL